jgi:hypothetical protein
LRIKRGAIEGDSFSERVDSDDLSGRGQQGHVLQVEQFSSHYR